VLPQRSKLKAFKAGTADTLYEVEVVNQSAKDNVKELPRFQHGFRCRRISPTIVSNLSQVED